MQSIKQKNKRQKVPRWVTIIATRLNIKFQPNKGSSFYKFPGKNKIPTDQTNWNCPIGTIRFSNHWNYVNSKMEKVYCNDKPDVKNGIWILCKNTGDKPNPWKVLQIFIPQKGLNIIKTINFNY